MNKRLVVTTLTPEENNEDVQVCCLLDDRKLIDVSVSSMHETSILHNIYIGKVQNIVKNIHAAFIEIQPGLIGYYPLEELESAICVNRQSDKKLVIGDELLVQVVKEPIKTKAAVLTTNLNFSGKYLVLTTGRNEIGISNKMDKQKRSHYKHLIEEGRKSSYGFIVRTNAAFAADEDVLQELSYLENQADVMIREASYRTVFSIMKQEEHEYIRLLRNAYAHEFDEIVTDDKRVYKEIDKYLKADQPQDLNKLRLYEDALLPLGSLYNLKEQLRHALQPRVWLKSGAYLLIEPTEAFTVIDVNTGKFDGHKNKQDTFLKINMEAAREIAVQIRLRNISGIILIDFINMQKQEYNEQLMEELRHVVANDHIKTNVIDMTPLGIVEMTRKKEHASLQQAVSRLSGV